MGNFQGKKFKLDGFNIRQKGTLVDVFARFCDINEETQPLINTQLDKIADADLRYSDEFPHLPLPTGVSVSVNDIVEMLIGRNDLAARPDSHRLPGPTREDLLADIGSKQMALLLVEMGKAKQTFLNGAETFIPAIKLENI